MVEPFGRPRRNRALMELLVTFIPYLSLAVAMMVLAQRGYT